MSKTSARLVMAALLALALALGAYAQRRERERHGQPSPAAASVQASPASTSPSAVRVLALVELPRQELTATLSGAYYDMQSRTLHAVQDRTPRLVALTASQDLGSFTLGAPLALRGRPESTWDGEAVARVGDALYVVAIETTARVERFDLAGNFQGTLALPARFAEHALSNKGLESLSAAPSGRVLFAANEAALDTDGPRASASAGTLVRIVKQPLGQGRAEERAYRTEPLGAGNGGGMGVSDLTALSDDELLVLERGYQPGYGNTVRIYRTDLRSAPDVSSRDALGPDAPLLKKTLVVDVGALPSKDVSHHSPQPNPLLENYEALALGPELPDGERVLLLVSDDNESDAQRPRVLVLSLSLPLSLAP